MLTLTLIQTQLAWQDKKTNLRLLEEKIESIPDSAEVVILPEMFSTGFCMEPQLLAETISGPTMEWMKDISRRHSVILTGSIIIEEEGRYYNRLVWMQPDGRYGYYDKRHLFAYAGENITYTPGNKRLVASVKGWRIHLQVCYDLRFPVWTRQQSHDQQPEYDILVNVANWPQKRIHAWKTLLCARAIENQCYTIGVNRVGDDGNNIYHSGNSLVIDPLGEVLYHMADEEDIFTITLQKQKLQEVRERFPFWKDGDSFFIQ